MSAVAPLARTAFVGFVGLTALLLCSSAQAQIAFQQDAILYATNFQRGLNWHSEGGVPVSAVAGSPAGSNGQAPAVPAPTPSQFQGALFIGGVTKGQTPGGLDPGASFAANADNLDWPRGKSNAVTVLVLRAQVGAPYVSRQSSFLFGSVIFPPSTDENGQPLATGVSRASYWQPEPYTTNGHATASYYWSPHAGAVFANQPGPISVIWKKTQASPVVPPDLGVNPNRYQLLSGLYYTLTNVQYIIAGSTAKTPRKIYWTEGAFRSIGKPVSVPTARVSAVKIAYNTAFPERVPAEFVAPGQSFITETTNRLQELRTLWFDTQQNQIYAYNREGRVFMELLGDPNSDGLTRKHLGYEIVDVFQQVPPADLTIELGELLTPYPDHEDPALTPEPLFQITGQTYTFAQSAAGRTVYYATRETANLNDLLVHWTELGLQGLKWPFIFSRYKLVWPDDVAKYSHYVRPVVPTEQEAKQTAVPLPALNIPAIEYQDPFDGPRGKLTESFAFYSFLDANVPAHRTLLRFTSGDKAAFERVFSWLDVNLKTPASFDGTIATNLSSWDPGTSRFDWSGTLFDAPRVVSVTVNVADRILPPAGELGASAGEAYMAGYILQTNGNSFHPGAYQDPFSNGFEAANKGAIIPVNAIPGKNHLDIWWFRRNPANAVKNESNGFLPIFWPAVVGRYTLQYPANPSEIILASNDGSGGLGSLQAVGQIYVQNNSALPGYNPNEEHALMLGGQAYALRDDLNITAGAGYSSEPFVLLDFTEADGRPAMRAFRVMREKPSAGILFDYVTVAGGDASQGGAARILQAPMPLPLLPAPVEGAGAQKVNYNTEPGANSGDLPTGWNPTQAASAGLAHYASFTYRDRKDNFWVYRGPHAGLPPLQAGKYNPASKTFGALPPAVAVAGQPFSYTIHASRLPDSLLLSTSDAPPRGISLGSMVLSGTPTEPGTYTLALAVTDVGDGANVRLTLTLEVAANGPVVTQGPLEIISTNKFAGANVTYVGRPPQLAEPPDNANSFTMRFYYKTQEGFAWPGQAGPPVGSIVPYLLPKDANGQPLGNPASKNTPSLDIVYRPVWAGNPPKMDFGETLTAPKKGLPAVRGQSSFQILYQQSVALTFASPQPAAVLHDPTREKFFTLKKGALDKLPLGVRTDSYQGKTFFPNLPPHLAQRFFFDPNRGEKGALALRGEFKDEIVGEKYILLNVLRDSDLATVKALCPPDSDDKQNWDAAIAGLSTVVQTFHDNPSVPGQYVPDPAQDRTVGIDALVEIGDDDIAVDSYALTSAGPGSGFVTIIAGNGGDPNHAGEPVSVYVFRVTGQLYTGELKAIASANPLNEMLTFQHTADLAGRFAEYEYEWRIAPPVDGVPPVNIPGDYVALANGLDHPRHTLGGSGIQVLIDNYVIMRYRPVNPSHPLYNQWSAWLPPQLAEGWIKRVLAGINPFNQRVSDLFNNTVNTDASILTQAGRRWEGDVALNLDTINNYGLIEIYETVLKRGKGLSIDAGINFGPANDALLLAAGYIDDLYMMLGNEAWADAANPTIGIGTKDKTYGEIATALFAFKGQVPTLLEEELALLRGRDDFLQPGVVTAPAYNRLFWNYTRGIDAGEVIYALNYNIQPNIANGTSGAIGAADAARMFPQAHGDAYGHYLTALKGYYSLLMDTDFDWVPRTEAVTILGKAVQVDYLDERKFAAAAAARARSGRQIFDLTWRKDYRPGREVGWEYFATNRVNNSREIVQGPATNHTVRYWGADYWASRATQGAYYDWIVGNSILPAEDPDPSHEGIQKIDRTTVPELKELAATGESVQLSLDNAEAHLTPLSLPEGGLAFDINPNLVTGANSQTHFEQIYGRAKGALNNAVTAFDDAKDVTRLMRSEQDSLADFQSEVAKQELSYTNALIEIYGVPYADDVGPGKTYSQGFAGPDLVHYMYVDRDQISAPGIFEPESDTTFKLDIQTFPEGWSGIGQTNFDIVVGATNSASYSNYLSYTLDSHGFLSKPQDWKSRRAASGKTQTAISRVIRAWTQANDALGNQETLKYSLDRQIELFMAQAQTFDITRAAQQEINDKTTEFEKLKLVQDLLIKTFESLQALADDIYEVLKESLSKDQIFGVATGGDLIFPARAIAGGLLLASKSVLNGVIVGLESSGGITENKFNKDLRDIEFNKMAPAEWIQSRKESVFQLEQAFNDLQGNFTQINQSLQELGDARRQYASLVAEGGRLLQERAFFRQRAAAVVQGFRTRDAAFRIFRNEKLERYKSLFDLASRYAYLSANAYDYETGQLGTSAGKDFLNRIVSSRALGLVKSGEPQFAGSDTGDPGLSSALAEMKADWDVLRARLGFNNPDAYGTTVSLRLENSRLLPGSDGDQAWVDLLNQSRKANLLEDGDVRRYCMQIDPGNGLPVPGIVLEFGTVIADAYNLFGKPIAAGDHAFSPSSFATKVFAIGVALEGYRGMDNPTANGSAVAGSGATSPADPSPWYLDPKALSATPYVYLIPVGLDAMRSPPLGDVSNIRTWSVDDVTIPMPFNIGASDFSSKRFYQSSDSLTEPLFNIRKHQAFRPVSTVAAFANNIYGIGGSLQPSQYTNRRLIGRSVWNTKWKLVIPGQPLLNDANQGLDRFIQTVKDVKLHLVTYSYAGN